MLRLLALLLVSELVRTGFFVSLLPLLGPGLGVTPGAIGLMVGVHYLMDALGKGPLGLVAERWGLGRLLLPGAALGLILVGAAHFFPASAGGVALWGVPVAGLWGLAYAALWPGIMSASQAFARPERLARALAVSNLTAAPAILAGVLLVGPLTQHSAELAWTLLLGAQGAALLLGLSLWGLRLPALPQPQAQTEDLVWPSRAWQDWRRVAVLLPAAFAQTLAPGLLVTLFYPLLAKLDLSLRDLIGPGVLAALCFAVSLGVLGRVADRFHPRRALTPGLLLLALTFGVVAYSDMPPVQGRLWWVAPLLGVGYGAFMAGWNGLVGRTLPPSQRAAGWGTVMAVEALGYAVGPTLGGVAWQLWGQRGVFLLGMAVFLLTELYYAWPARQMVELQTQGNRKGPSGGPLYDESRQT